MIAPTLRSFVPPALIRAAASATDNDLRDATRFHAAVLFADISGFTRIADAHARRGPAGIDALSSILRAYFGALIDRVARHGGEVLRFAGDAPIALWICPADQLDEALRAAVSCAFSLRDGLRGFDAGDGATLSMRLGVGSGSLLGVRGGGVEGRWEFLVGGAALDDACRAEATVRPGELALSADAWARVGHLLRGAPTRDGAMHVERWRTPPREPHTLPPPPPYDERLTPWVRRFVSRAVLHRLDAGQARWLAELRRVSVLFLSLGEIEFAAPEAPARIDAAVRAIQTEVYRQGGSINQLLVDDKGTVLVAAWGLPAHTHEDDPYRAVRAAMALRATLAAMGLRPSVGVASGRVFCGERGNATRCEYGLIGDRVNLAARLMQHADGAVLCDDATRALTRGVVDYHPARAVSVRHRAEPVEAWEPMDVSPSQSVGRARREGTTFVGRGAERALLDRLLTPATSPDAGALVVVEGEPGIGKSRVVEYACEVATRGGYDVLRGGGDAQSVAAPYHAWQTVFHQVLGVDRQRPRPERAERVRAALRDVDPGLAELVGLLDAVTGLELPDSSRTAEMTGQVRADNTRQLLLRLLSERARTRPTLVVFDDAHWMDSPSLDLLREVHRTARGVTVLVATRPVSDDAPASLLQLRHTADHHLRLAALDAHDTVALACACLGVDALPAAVARLVSERAGGNPLFGEEIALALRDERAITVRDGHCEVDAGRALDALTLPDTLEGIIASRLDRLHPAEQFTLKVASVFGREFGLEALEGVHPMSEARAGLGEQLEHMARLDLVVRLQDAAARRFMFKHALTRDAVYTLLPTEQRQVLHGGVARWLEKALGVDVTLSLGLLAWHWEQAGDAARALDYGDRAGEDALQRGAYREALFFLERARALDVPRHAAPDRLRAVRRERRLGDAWFGLGDMANSRHHLDRALLLAGHPPPDTARAWQRTVVRELGRQAQHLVVPPNHAALDDEQRALLAEVSAVTAAISEQRYYEADIPGWLACTLLSINAAERAGRLDAAGRGYMGVGYLAGLLRLKPLSRRWFDRALRWGDARARGMALGAEGLSHVGFGRWSDAARCFDESESQLRELGDRFALANTLYMRVHLWTWRGDLPRAVDAATRLRAVAAEAANVQHQVWALVELMALGVITGDLDAARAALVPCEEMVQRTDALSRWRSHGVRAMLHRAMGDTAKARAHADEALVWMRHSPPSAFADYHAVMGVAEVSLDQWDASGARAPRGDGVALSRSGATALGRLFPVLQARASWLDGEVLHREGRTKAALDAWRRGVERARAHGMTYDEALNAWSLRRDPREGATWRRRARDGFLRAGAHGWVRRVDEEP